MEVPPIKIFRENTYKQYKLPPKTIDDIEKIKTHNSFGNTLAKG